MSGQEWEVSKLKRNSGLEKPERDEGEGLEDGMVMVKEKDGAVLAIELYEGAVGGGSRGPEEKYAQMIRRAEVGRSESV